VLVGPSGCGKSTLLRLLAGLESLSAGTILMNNRPINDLDPADRDVAMVFQSYALYPHLTVAENLAFHMQVKKVDKATQKNKVQHIASMLGIDKLLGRYPRALSGGQRQRVAMGRAMVRNPQVFCSMSRSPTSMPSCAWSCGPRSNPCTSASTPP
jgi:multiple sugar transport system ATP-binding protein